MNLPSIEPITISELYEMRKEMLALATGGAPAGVGVWVISDYLIDDIAKESLGLDGGCAHFPARPGEALHIFGAPVVQVQTPARIVSFSIWCALCGAWLKPGDDGQCQVCGHPAVI